MDTQNKQQLSVTYRKRMNSLLNKWDRELDEILKRDQGIENVAGRTKMRGVMRTLASIRINQLLNGEIREPNHLFNYVFNPRELYPYRGREYKQTQGLLMTANYLSEAVTAVAGAFSAYLLYKTGTNVYHTVREFTISPNIMELIKQHLFDIVAFLTAYYKWHQGKITTAELMLIVAGIGGWILSRKALLSSLATFLQSVPTHSTNRETQGFEPTTFIESLISLVSIFTLGSLNGIDSKSIMGSVRGLGAAILTVKTVEQCFVNIITYLPDIVQVIIARTVPAFGLYVKLNTDQNFKDFIVKTHKLQDCGLYDMYYNSHNLATFLRQYNYLKRLVLDDDNINSELHKLIPDIIKWYDDKYLGAAELGLLPGKRKLPFVIWISGDPGIGKSTLVPDLCREILRGKYMEMGDEDISKYVYNHNTSNKYFDGYNNQPIFVLNDYLQFAQENEEQWLIRFADTLDCPLEVSSVDNIELGVKGEVRFTSRIIIITSNVTYLSASNTVTSVEAFNRRRNIVIDMKWKPNASIDFHHFDYTWANIRRRSALEYGPQSLDMPIEGLDELFTIVVEELDLMRIRSSFVHDKQQNEVTSLQREVRAKHEAQGAYTNMLNKLWDNLNYYGNKEFLGIKLRYLIPLVVGGTSAAYLLYKKWIPVFVGKFTQSLSGDVSTSKIKKITRPLRKITMGANKNNMEVADKLYRNTVKITSIVTAPDGQRISQTMWGWGIGGSLILTPKHLWRRGTLEAKEGDLFKIERAGIISECYVNKENLYFFEEEDLAVVNIHSYTSSAFKEMSKFLLDDKHYINEAGEDALLIVPRENTNKPDATWPALIPVTAYITDAPYKDEFGEVYEGRGIWQYNQKMVKGDCGSLLVISTNNGMKIAGMHVAGDNYSGNAEVFTQSMYDQVVSHFTRTTQGFVTDVELTEDEFFDAESDLDGNWYYLGKAKRPPFQNAKTEIRPSPLYEVLQPHLTEPAVLYPSDPRLTEKVSPVLKSVAKYGSQVIPFPPELLEKAFSIVQDMYYPIGQYKLKTFEYDDAINARYTPSLEKLDLKTSPGYPWNTQGFKKADLIENNDGVLVIGKLLNDVLEADDFAIANHMMFPYTLTTTLKDERVALAKVAIGKTRTFMNFPVEYNILLRKYFDDFIDKETKHAMEIGTTVGVNIYSSRWNDLFRDLARFPHCTDGDFKAFDGTIRPEFFRYYARLVNMYYKDEYTGQRALLVDGCCFAPMFVLDKVYVKLQGNPSGSRLTTSFNSFTNRMYVVMSILNSMPRSQWTIDFFRKNIKIYAHGDDHIIGFSDKIREKWSALVLRDFMLQHGIDYTSSTKDAELTPTRALMDCYYLKSYFVYDKQSGQYRAGLDKTVIQEMVSWQRDETTLSTEMIVNTALRYAYFWGQDYFFEIHSKLLEAIRLKRINIKLIDFDSLDYEYRYNDMLSFDFA